MSRKREITDVEVAINFFCVTFYDYDTKKRITYEISYRKNDILKIQQHWRNLCKEKAYLVTFNGNHYDIPVFLYLNSLDPNDLYDYNLLQIYYFSKHIIETDGWWLEYKYKKYKYPRGIESVDLYTYWSKMLRLSKKISLKSLGIQLKYDTVQELPYDPNEPIPTNKFDEVIHYNRIHDINLTKLLTDEMKPDIKLREKIKHDYGFKCMSWDSPKIGMNILREKYKEFTGQKLEISKDYNLVHLQDVILPKINFNDKLIKSKNLYYSNSQFLKDLKEKSVSNTNQLNARVVKEQANGMQLVSDFMSGGLHGTAFKGILEPKEDEVILDYDVNSYYPSLIEMLGALSNALPTYSEIKKTRVTAKKNGDKIVSDTLKLVLNSVYGMLGNDYSGIKNLKDVLSVTINGQLILQMFTEMLMKHDISVIYQNTK